MSSATSSDRAASERQVEVEGRLTHDQSLQPWQFFVLAGLGCATAATIIARGQGVVAILLLSVLMAGAVLIGLAALRALLPLVTPDYDRTVMVGQRTRAALEREKLLALRAIKELEFDRAMGKLSEDDFKEMAGRLRARAGGLIRQLDAGAGYRQKIERDVEARLERSPTFDVAQVAPSVSRGAKASAERSGDQKAERVCASCETANDADAKFCKGCGQRL